MGPTLKYTLLILASTFVASCANSYSPCEPGDTYCFTHPESQGVNANGISTVGTQGSPLDDSNVTKTLIIDDFSNVTVFNNGLNSLSPAQGQGDGASMSVYALADNNRMQLQCAGTNCYWYSLLAGQGSCLDLRAYTHIAFTIQGAAGGDATFQLQNNNADCSSTNFAGSQGVDLATFTMFDGQPHEVLLPLSAFPQVDQVHGRAIAIANLTPNIAIYLSNIRLVAVDQGQ